MRLRTSPTQQRHAFLLTAVQAYLAFGDERYLTMFSEVYAAAMTHLQLDPNWNGNVWCVRRRSTTAGTLNLRHRLAHMPGQAANAHGPLALPICQRSLLPLNPCSLLDLTPPACRLVDVDMSAGSAAQPPASPLPTPPSLHHSDWHAGWWMWTCQRGRCSTPMCGPWAPSGRACKRWRGRCGEARRTAAAVPCGECEVAASGGWGPSGQARERWRRGGGGVQGDRRQHRRAKPAWRAGHAGCMHACRWRGSLRCTSAVPPPATCRPRLQTPPPAIAADQQVEEGTALHLSCTPACHVLSSPPNSAPRRCC